MAGQGVMTTAVQVAPFSEGDIVKKFQQLIEPSEEQKKNDMRFLRGGEKVTVEGSELDVLNTCLETTTEVLSFVGGPAGVILGSGICLFQGLISLFGQKAHPTPGPSLLETMEVAMHKVHDQEQTKLQLAKVREIALVMKNQWIEFVDDPRPSATDEKMNIDKELMKQTGVDEGSLAVTLSRMEELLTWDNTTVRVAILSSLTYLFMIWNLQCRIYASLIRIEESKPRAERNHEHYNDYVTGFEFRVRKMKNELATRTTRLRALYDDMKTKRIANTTWIGIEKERPLGHSSALVVVKIKYKDTYANAEYAHVVTRGGNKFNPDKRDIDEFFKVAQADYEKYKIDLADFATRAMANDLAIVDQWAAIVGEAEMLCKLMPIKHPLLADLKSQFVVGSAL